MTKAERDVHIGKLYEAGETVYQIAKRVNLTHVRVRQILKNQHKFVKNRHLDYSDREKFLGVNISATVKAALRKEAERRGISMSSLSADTLKDMLIACGYPVEAEQVTQ